jgi:protein SCO1/2
MNTSSESGKGMRATLVICAVVIALGLVVAWNYVFTLNRQAQNPDYLPIIHRLDRDLDTVNQMGKEAGFFELRGKVWVLGYVFTRCPVGCLGVMEYQQKLQKEFGDRDDFHLVSITMDPEEDTPEQIAKWTEEKQLGGDNWWFLTGVGKKIRSYMGKYFRLYINQRQDPDEIALYGEWDHELKLVLVDQTGAIRYYYDVMNVSRGENQFKKLRNDVTRLLEGGPTTGQPQT